MSEQQPESSHNRKRSETPYQEDFSIKGNTKPSDLNLIQCARLIKNSFWAIFRRLCICDRVIPNPEQDTASKKVKGATIVYHCHRPDMGCPKPGNSTYSKQVCLVTAIRCPACHTFLISRVRIYLRSTTILMSYY